MTIKVYAYRHVHNAPFPRKQNREKNKLRVTVGVVDVVAEKAHCA